MRVVHQQHQQYVVVQVHVVMVLVVQVYVHVPVLPMLALHVNTVVQVHVIIVVTQPLQVDAHVICLGVALVVRVVPRIIMAPLVVFVSD
jgi:hypothetical protein